MHLRSPAGPISVYVLNPPDPDSEASSTHPEAKSQADSIITRGGALDMLALQAFSIDY